MKSFFLPALALLALSVGAARAATTTELKFDGTQGGIGNTGFTGVYNEDPASYSLGPNGLTIVTKPGDIFGRYETDPDDAKNVFYIEPGADPMGATTVETRITVANMLQNFQGGGIWLGTDEDHYIRLGVIHNGNNLNVEALRENEDLWNHPPDHTGPGGDIVGAQATVGTAPGPLDVTLRLVRNDGTATAFYSMNGVDFSQVGGTFNYIVTGPGQGWNGGPTIEGGFKVGAYAFGGDNPATVTFRYLRLTTYAASEIPEPGSMALLLAGLPGLFVIRRKRA